MIASSIFFLQKYRFSAIFGGHLRESRDLGYFEDGGAEYPQIVIFEPQNVAIGCQFPQNQSAIFVGGPPTFE